MEWKPRHKSPDAAVCSEIASSCGGRLFRKPRCVRRNALPHHKGRARCSDESYWWAWSWPYRAVSPISRGWGQQMILWPMRSKVRIAACSSSGMVATSTPWPKPCDRGHHHTPERRVSREHIPGDWTRVHSRSRRIAKAWVQPVSATPAASIAAGV